MTRPPTRLSAFAAELTREMLEAFFDGYPVRPRAARAVAEARIRELAREVDGDIQGPAQTYLDEPVSATKPTKERS